MRYHREAIAAFALGFAALLPQAHAAESGPAYVTAAVADTGRPRQDIDRDAVRKPAEVLAFAQVKPGQVAVDFIPGDGYYTRLLSVLVGNKGTLYSIVPLAEVGDAGALRKAEAEGAKAGKPLPMSAVDTALAIQNTEEYRNMTVLWEPLNQYGGQFSIPRQADVVFTSAYHELHSSAYAKVDMSGVLKMMFRSLKPGGVVVVEDSAADADAVKTEVTAAGFVLDSESKAVDGQFLYRFKKPTDAKTPDKRPPADFMKNYYGNTYVYNVGNARERHHFYHPDGTYQEFGKGDPQMQSGTDYWDVDGHNCQLHQFPVTQRAFIVCHGIIAHDVGEKTTQDNGAGAGGLPATILKGIVYP
jgi:predicted methyltransferase